MVLFVFTIQIAGKECLKCFGSQQQAEEQFGFLMNAFPPWCSSLTQVCVPDLDSIRKFIMAGLDTIRDVIAFPKNNSGRDVMLDAPSVIAPKQLDELQIKLDLKE